jgi:anti-sigma factor ChrR (cupin superfamily)
MNPLDPKSSNAPPSAKSEILEADALPNAWNELLLMDTQMKHPDAAVKDKIHARVKARMSAEPTPAAQEASQGFTRISSAQGWKRLHEKAEMKVLLNDGVTVTWLLKLAPGGSIVPHAHDKGLEECLVVQGSVLLNNELYEAGDYQVAQVGTSHEAVLSEQGCVVMLRSPAGRERELHLYAGYTRVAEPMTKVAKQATSVTAKFMRALMPERFRK